MLERLVKFLILCFLFLTGYRLFSIPISIIALFLSIAFILFFRDFTGIKSIFQKDSLKRLLAIILLITIITYLLKSGNIERIEEIVYYTSRTKPDYLYLKMAMNGVFCILTAMIAFSLGFSYNGNESAIKNIISFIINSITVFALLNIITWFLQTGGVIGRYNFNSILNSSFGTNIQWSILGFLLQISTLKKRRNRSFQIVKLTILLLSILIVLSRENQVMFIILLLLYIYNISKKMSLLKVIGLVSIFVGSLVYFSMSYWYESLLNTQGDDILVRLDILVSAVKIFKDNMILGVGYGMFAGYNTTSISITGVQSYLNSAHNGFFSILAEMGIIGLILNIKIAYEIIYRLFRIERFFATKGFREKKYIIVVYLFITINIFSALISNYILFPPPSEYAYYGIMFISWLLIGIILSFEKRKSLKVIC